MRIYRDVWEDNKMRNKKRSIENIEIETGRSDYEIAMDLIKEGFPESMFAGVFLCTSKPIARGLPVFDRINERGERVFKLEICNSPIPLEFRMVCEGESK